MLLLAQADRLLLALAGLAPGARLLGPLQDAQCFIQQALTGNDIEHDAQLAGALRLDRLAGTDQFRSQGRANDPRQALRSAPARKQADLDFRQAELRLGVRGGDAEVEPESQLQPAAHACSLDGGHGGIGQGFH